MIHANELMAGDYLRVNRGGLCIKKGIIVEVRGIDADRRFDNHTGCAFCNPLDDNQFGGGIWCDYLDPIPLTPEILEKNYSSTPEWYFDGTNKYCLRISRYKDKWNFYYGRGGNGMQIQINIQYVHELQHCLKLCGIDKTIEL